MVYVVVFIMSALLVAPIAELARMLFSKPMVDGNETDVFSLIDEL